MIAVIERFLPHMTAANPQNGYGMNAAIIVAVVPSMTLRFLSSM